MTRSRSKNGALSTAVISVLVAAVTLASLTPSGSQDKDGPESVRDRFIGAWRLVRLEEVGADGKVSSADSAGVLVFTREGRMSVQVMSQTPQAEAPAGPVRYSLGGYEASFGRYEIDESAHTFTYHVEGALVRSLIGKDLPRLFQLSDKQLIVRSSDPKEHWRVVWEHY